MQTIANLSRPDSSRSDRDAFATTGNSSGSGPRPPRKFIDTPRFIGDRIFNLSTLIPALIVLAIVAGFVAVLVAESRPSLARFGLRFFGSAQWDPVRENFGALPFIYGTLVSSSIALFLAVPLSLGVALCMVEMAPQWLATKIGFLVELLAAIPSVVYGLWGIFVLGPWIRNHVDPVLAHYLGFLPLFRGPHLGVSMLSAGVILAVMIIPYISAVCTDVFRAVPRMQRESALALGATKWEVIRTAVLPYGRVGVVGAIIMGLGRALGETIAVAMVIGNRPQISASLFMPSATLASVIANEFTEANTTMYLSSLVELGLTLLILAVILNAIARALVTAVGGRQGEVR